MNTKNTNNIQSDLAKEKQHLRMSMLAQRKALPEESYAALSLMAQKYLLHSTEWQKASSISLYMSVRGELDTSALLDSAWSSGKEIFLPLCSTDIPGHMEMIRCNGLHAMRRGTYGIMEPDPEVAILPDNTTNLGMSLHNQNNKTTLPYAELLILPGVLFDLQGYRIGMGGGYYDRLLSKTEYASCLRIGLAFEFQVVNNLPHEAWDLPMHAICTENGIIRLT